jgi:hypothetical protein
MRQIYHGTVREESHIPSHNIVNCSIPPANQIALDGIDQSHAAIFRVVLTSCELEPITSIQVEQFSTVNQMMTDWLLKRNIRVLKTQTEPKMFLKPTTMTESISDKKKFHLRFVEGFRLDTSSAG